jgi:hypothetical protein
LNTCTVMLMLYLQHCQSPVGFALVLKIQAMKQVLDGILIDFSLFFSVLTTLTEELIEDICAPVHSQCLLSSAIIVSSKIY